MASSRRKWTATLSKWYTGCRVLALDSRNLAYLNNAAECTAKQTISLLPIAESQPDPETIKFSILASAWCTVAF